jgi:SAM-dependent methyltransferase
MLKRIPHSSQDISGEIEIARYIRGHQKHKQAQFRAFLAELTHQQKRNQSILNGRFLEIGSGPGFLTEIIANRYPQAEINAVELSPDMIEVAKTTVNRTQTSSRVRFLEGSIDDRSFMVHLGKFDLVYSTFSLHHWGNPINAIKHMYRALREGGLMILHDLKRVFWLYALPSRNGFISSVRAAYRPDELEHMMTMAKIKDFRIKTPFPYFWHTILAWK